MENTKIKTCENCPDFENCYSERDWINCCRLGNHAYDEVTCPKYGHVYCYECAGSTGENPYQGGSYRSCPVCAEVIVDRPWEL